MNDRESVKRDDSRDRLVLVLSALDDIGRVLADRDDVHDASRHLLRLLLGTIGISRGAIYSAHHPSTALNLEVSTFTDLPQLIPELLTPDESDGLDMGPIDLESYKAPDTPAVDKLIRALSVKGVRLLVPLSVRNRFLGLICLGSRFMQMPYQPDDVEIIRLLARHISLFFHARSLIAETRAANFRLNRKILELENLFELGLSITSLQILDDLVMDVVIKAAAILNARYGALVEWKDGTPVIRAGFGYQPGSEQLPDGLRGVPYLDPEIEPETRNDQLFLAAPLTCRRITRGCLLVMLKENRQGGFDCFNEEDRMLLSAFANQAAVALENADLLKQAIEKERIDKELEVASEIQRALLPVGDPTIEGIDASGRTIPCRTVGGDYFGYGRLPDGKHLVTIADVSGKSVPASLLVSTYHTAFLALQEHCEALPETTTALNQIIFRATPENRFITACLACWDPIRRRIEIVVAGHESPILIRADGSMERITEGGLILGLFSHAVYESRLVTLNPGDMIGFYSDGITDLQNTSGERFGPERLIECLRNHADMPASAVCDKVFEIMSCFQGNAPVPDDQTLVIIKCMNPI